MHRAALCQRAKTDVLRNLSGVPVDSGEVCTPRLPARLWAWEPVDVRHTLPAGSGRSSGHSPCLSRPTGRQPAARLLGRPGPGPGAQPGITARRSFPARKGDGHCHFDRRRRHGHRHAGGHLELVHAWVVPGPVSRPTLTPRLAAMRYTCRHRTARVRTGSSPAPSRRRDAARAPVRARGPAHVAMHWGGRTLARHPSTVSSSRTRHGVERPRIKGAD